MDAHSDSEIEALKSEKFYSELDSSLLPKRFGNSVTLVESIPIAEFQGRPIADHLGVKHGRPPGALRAPRLPIDPTTLEEAVSVISCWYENSRLLVPFSLSEIIIASNKCITFVVIKMEMAMEQNSTLRRLHERFDEILELNVNLMSIPDFRCQILGQANYGQERDLLVKLVGQLPDRKNQIIAYAS